jgi:hypothetical protein
MWADLKRFVNKKMCRNEKELIASIDEFKKTLTPEICKNYIKKLKEVK